jgi:hypothetical protein
MRATAARAMEPPLKQQQPATCQLRESGASRGRGKAGQSQCALRLVLSGHAASLTPY